MFAAPMIWITDTSASAQAASTAPSSLKAETPACIEPKLTTGWPIRVSSRARNGSATNLP